MLHLRENGLQLFLNEADLTASIVGSSNDGPSKIIVPNSVVFNNQTYIITTISSFSFKYNFILDSLIFTEDSKLQKIQKYAFSQSVVRRLILPESLKEIEDGWANDSRLKTVIISPKNQYYEYINSCLLVEKETSTIIFATKDIKKIIIPSYIKRLAKFSFANCSSLVSLEFEEYSQLHSIGYGAFSKTLLDRIFIPNSVEYLENGWCLNADYLEFVKVSSFNQNIRYVRKYLLVSKNENNQNVIVFVKKNAESLIIPSNIHIIGAYSFAYCKFVKTITFAHDSQLTRISVSAFYSSALEIIEIPKTVEKIDDGWCSWATSLYDVKLSPHNPNLQIYDNKILIGKGYILDDNDEDQVETKEFATILFSWKDYDEIVIPKFIKRIAKFGFEFCPLLKKVSFEDNSQLRSIGYSAFYGCPLRTICIPALCDHLNKWWCKKTKFLVDIIIDPRNRFYEYVDKTYLYADSGTSLLFARRNISEAQISPTIKIISSGAFEYCKYLVSLTFASDSQESQLAIIESMAFMNCVNLLSVKFLNSIRKIGAFAFRQCKKLQSVEFQSYDQSQLEEIHNSCFELCEKLKSFKIPNNLKRIGLKAFYSCANLKTFEIPSDSKLKEISRDCFSYTNIKELKLPSTIKYLQNGFCHESRELNYIQFEPNPNYFCFENNKFLIDKINNILLYSSKDVENVQIPRTIQVIGASAFLGCQKLHTITFEENSEITTICKGAFCKSTLANLELPKTIDLLEDGWCKETLDLVNLAVAPNNPRYFLFDNQLLLGDYSHCWYETEGDENPGFLLIFANRNIEKALIPYSVRHVGYAAFEACRKLSSVLFLRDGEKLPMARTFRYNSFAMCNMLSYATIPNNLQVVGRGAFVKCSNIKSMIYLSEKPVLKEIQDFAFAFCSNLQSVSIPDSVRIIQRNAFYDCRQLFAVTIGPQSRLTYIGKRVFSFTNLTQLKLPKSIEKLDDQWMEDTHEHFEVIIPEANKFYKFINGCLISQTIDRKIGGCIAYVRKNVENVVIPNSILKICHSAFSYCQSLQSLTWESNGNKPLNILKIPSRAFYSCIKLKSFEIPSSIHIIDKYAFFYCCLLENLIFQLDLNQQSELNSIMNSVYFCCGSLAKIEFPASLIQLGDSSFENCYRLSEVVFPNNSQLAIINTGAFGGTVIREFAIPSSIIHLEEGWSRGTRTFDHINIPPNNSSLFYLSDHFLIKVTNQENILMNILTDTEEIVVPSCVNRIGKAVFANCNQCHTIAFEDNSKLTSIGNEILKDSSIKTLHLPESLQQLDDSFGSNASFLTSIVLSPKNTRFRYIDNKFLVGNNGEVSDFSVLFFAQKKILTARIPSYIKKISKYAFNKCQYLKKVKFEADSILEELDDHAFSYCTNLELVDSPRSVKRIGSSCFSHNSQLRSIELPCNNATIVSYAFIDCGNLSLISLQNTKTITFDEDSLLRASDNIVLFMSPDSDQIGLRTFIKSQ